MRSASTKNNMQILTTLKPNEQIVPSLPIGKLNDLARQIAGLPSSYLKLDQSTPQTVTASPIFNWGTSTRIPFYDASKKLTDSAGLVFDDTNRYLNIQGTASKSPILRFLNNSGTLMSDLYYDVAGGVGLNLINRQNTDLRFSTNTILRAIIKNDGKVGIGTSTPSSGLNLVDTGAGMVVQRSKTAGDTATIANNGDAKFIMGVDFNNNPNIELQAGKTGFAKGFAAYIDFTTTDGADYDSRIIKWGDLGISDNQRINISAPSILLSNATTINGGLSLDPSTAGDSSSPNSDYFTLSYYPVSAGTVSGTYAGGASSFYDDGSENLLDTGDDHQIGTITYSTGFIDTTGYNDDFIDNISYTYSSATIWLGSDSGTPKIKASTNMLLLL